MGASKALGTSPSRRPSRLPAHQGKVWSGGGQVVTWGCSAYILEVTLGSEGRGVGGAHPNPGSRR